MVKIKTILFLIIFISTCVFLILYYNLNEPIEHKFQKVYDDIELTKEEKQWLAKEHIVNINIGNFRPYLYIKNGTEKGISVDLFKYFMDTLNIEYKINFEEATINDLLEQMQKGKGPDLLLAMLKSKDREKFLDFTYSYIDTFSAIFYNKKVSLKAKTKIAVIESNAIHEYIKKEYPNAELVFFETSEEAFFSMTSGETDFYVDNLSMGSYLTKKFAFSNITIDLIEDTKTSLSFAIRKDWKELTSILNKMLENTPESLILEVAGDYIDLKLVGYEEDDTEWYIFLVILSILLIIFFIYLYMKLKEIKQKEQKQLEKEILLLQEKELAKKESNFKSIFLANMSHDIRTPMNIILGFISIMLEKNKDEEFHEYLKKVNNVATNLLGLLNDILDISKIEAGKIEIEKNPFDIYSVMEKVVEIFSVQVNEKGIELHLYMDKQIPKLLGDQLRLMQILNNLISNSVKFTSKGSICIHLTKIFKDEKNITLKFIIKDTGIGIKEDQLSNIFKSFSQASSSITREFGGSGLGLSIVKNFIELMNGKVWVESTYSKGSNFYIELPFELSKEEKEDFFNPIFPRKLKFLIIDDNKTARDNLEFLLKEYGDINKVSTGEKGLNSIKNNSYDIIFIDWNMQTWDGIYTAQEINKLKLKKVPIMIMVTAYKTKNLIDKAKKVGFKAFLNKPLLPSILYRTILDCLNNKQSSTYTTSQKWSDYRFVDSKILIAEDNQMNQELIKEIFKKSNINIVIVENGLLAIQKVKKESFDLILMDIQMPKMNGLEAAKKIRELNFTLPIIAMTANAMESDKKKSLESGMNEHLSKPINPKELFKLISKYIKRIKNKKDIIKNEKVVVFEKNTSLETRLDTKKGLMHCLDNKKLYSKQLNDFIKKYKKIEKEFSKIKDYEEAKRYIHTLKGCCGTIGANLSYKLAAFLEQNLKQNEFSKQAQELFKEIEVLLEEIVLYLQKNEEKEEEKEIKTTLTYKNNILKIKKYLENFMMAEALALLEKAKLNSEHKQSLENIEKYMKIYDYDNSILEVEKLIKKLE